MNPQISEELRFIRLCAMSLQCAKLTTIELSSRFPTEKREILQKVLDLPEEDKRFTQAIDKILFNALNDFISTGLQKLIVDYTLPESVLALPPKALVFMQKASNHVNSSNNLPENAQTNEKSSKGFFP